MSGPSALTYTNLLTDLDAYCERGSSDAAFQTQKPRFVMLAEQRIAAEAKGLGMLESVQDVMIPGVNGSSLTKPAEWRQHGALFIGTGTGYHARVQLKLRSYSYCRSYAPDETVTDQPVYYADWDWRHYLIVPSPDLAYPYELLYFRRPAPLSDSNTTNWTTQYAPQLLTFACLLEASAWAKNPEMIQQWQTGYDRALKQVEFEGRKRLKDLGVDVEDASNAQ